MHTRRLRLAQLALENMPFPLHQSRTVLDLHAADGATTQYLQYFMPYSTVFGLTADPPSPTLPACGQKYLAALPSGFRCDCVVALVEASQPLAPILNAVRTVNARWELILAPWQAAHSIDWQALGYQTHNEMTEEPDDGVIVVAVRDREAQHQTSAATPRVLIASPVRQKPAILQHFLEGLRRLDTTGLEIAYLFVDNNDDAQASQMLRAFKGQVSAPVHCLRLPVAEPYQRTEASHHWTESLIWRLAAIKDGMLHAALQHDYDYVFLVDSDLVLHPQTLRRMVSCQRDILAQVFWTVWSHDKPPLPNVWYADHYNLYRVRRKQTLERDEQVRRTEAFLSALAFYSGVYRVSGLGACTLISRRAIEAGVGFSELRGSLHTGEDRHLCLRAESLGLRLFADATLPPLHLYRESELLRVEGYWRLVESGMQGADLNRAMFELLLGRTLQAA
ncbi:MAG: glycosyltransferase [Fimbriimonadales bacterium]|nr:MAG: hypothetical protein KatS3mg018_0937 [Fimbriimonadales bacterium]